MIAPAAPTPGGLNGNSSVSGASKPVVALDDDLHIHRAGAHQRHLGLNDFDVVRHLFGHGHRQLVNDAVNEHRVVGFAEDEVGVVFEAAFDGDRLLWIGQLRSEVDSVAIERRVFLRLEYDGHERHARVHRPGRHRDAGNQDSSATARWGRRSRRASLE